MSTAPGARVAYSSATASDSASKAMIINTRSTSCPSHARDAYFRACYLRSFAMSSIVPSQAHGA